MKMKEGVRKSLQNALVLWIVLTGFLFLERLGVPVAEFILYTH